MNPEHCPLGKHPWQERGQFACPDLLLIGDNDQIGIVRVDGAIHDNKKHIISDAWRVRHFHEWNVKVFVVCNEHIDGFELSKRSKRKTLFPIRCLITCIWLLLISYGAPLTTIRYIKPTWQTKRSVCG